MKVVPNDNGTGPADASTQLQDSAIYTGIIAQAFGKGFTAAFGSDFSDTNDAVTTWLGQNTRSDSNPPAPVDIQQVRIGASTFFVPPTQISVVQQFESGSLTGAAIRQISSPKFNSGHSVATIKMSIYFPGVQNIWGYDGTKIDLDFMTAPDAEVDAFASSLRGFITQFRYTPFVPVVNQYLNEVWNITSVGLQSLQISNVPGFPYLVRADLTMVDFNHTIFLPMVNTLDDAIDWGRFRQYLGRAAVKLDAQANQAFATQQTVPSSVASKDPNLKASAKNDALGADTTLTTSFASVIQDIGGASGINFYYPTQDPAQIWGPTNFAFSSQQGGTTNFSITDPNTWFNVLGFLGFGAGNSINSSVPNLNNIQQFLQDPTIQQEVGYIKFFLQQAAAIAGAAADQTGGILPDSGKFQQYQKQAYARMGIGPNSTADQKKTADQAISGGWYTYVYQQYVGNSPALQALFALQDLIRGTVEIDEWDVPMVAIPVDKNKMIVQNVTVNIGNNLARLQLDMVDRPAYQHIGGLDTIINVDMVVLDEATVTAFRTMFDTINGLARLEHAHAVLGFLGIKNLMTALVGTRYVIPRSFEVETVEGHPHLFQVRLSFLDFDVFQQKREMLSSNQEQQFIQLMSKRNPFLRLQQVWSALNTYSDFPLGITDQEGNIAGHLDPDFYFVGFDTIDDDIVNAFDNPPKYGAPGSSQTSKNSDYPIVWHQGPMATDDSHQSIGLSGQCKDLRESDNIIYSLNQHCEAHAGNTHGKPLVKDAKGNNPATPPNKYQTPNFEMDHTNSNSGTSKGNFFSMMRDLQFRDMSGRMIRAFPTYMLWLINENGNEFAGINLFSDFYGLQSVLDFSLVSNQDVMGDTLEIRISNLYSRLSTPYQDLVDPSIFPQVASLVNGIINTDRNRASGLNPNFQVNIETFNLTPGTRMHLRVGYGSDPNGLETIFNGVVTEVQQGQIMTIIAQSDAVELGAIVNTSNPSGDSGSIDGSLTSGWYLSEPRDLIVRLLSMGESTIKQAISYATRGMLFSGNKFGIKHFGNILYDTMSDREKTLADSFTNTLESISGDVQNWLSTNQDSAGGGDNSGVINTAVGMLSGQLWVNLNSQRDYEVFKRNVYPGNGTGVAMYMGGDLGDGGLNTAFQPPGVNSDGTAFTPGPDPLAVLGVAGHVASNPNQHDIPSGDQSTATNSINNIGGTVLSFGNNVPGVSGAVKTSASVFEAVTGSITWPITSTYDFLHPIWQILGIQPEVTDDVPGTKIPFLGTYGPFAEVSFRAETYQKTVWDLFRLCAKMLPNYIVAVRPFMERSTVFYGKPHWAYTSGVIPLTYGADTKGPPQQAMYDQSMQQLINQLTDVIATKKNTTSQDLYNQLNSLTPKQLSTGNTTGNSNSPSSVGGAPGGGGVANTGGGQATGVGAIEALPLIHPKSGAVIKPRSGPTCIEMHLPTSADLATDISQHEQLPDLPAPYRHPFYMDRVGGGVGGVNPDNTFNPAIAVTAQTEISGDSPSSPGKSGAFGILTPTNEQFYMNMDWDTTAAPYPTAWAGHKVMVFNPANLLGCICTPGDWGPASSTGRDSGISPDTWYVLGQPGANAVLWYGWVDDSVPVGPASWVSGNTFQGNPLSSPAKTAAGGKQASLDLGSGTNVNPVTAPSSSSDSSGSAPAAPAAPPAASINKLAQQVYGNTRSTEEAQEIESEFLGQNNHTSFIKDKATYKVFQAVYPDKSQAQFQQVTQDFVNWVMSNPYAVGWMVLTANRATSLAQDIGAGANLLIDPIGAIFGPAAMGIEDALGAPAWLKTGTQWVLNPTGGLISSAITGVTGVFHAVEGFFSHKKKPDDYDFTKMRDLYKVYITQGVGVDSTAAGSTGQSSGAIDYMLTHTSPGLNSTNIIGQSIEGLAKNVVTDIVNFVKDIYKLASAAFGAIESLMRWGITMFNNAISLSGFAGKQANMLNGVFNDSYYYDPALGVGSILWQADNCFTREYSEPVVEVRQPFQRVHYINSFQHILTNNITERLGGVPTVVTASANGRAPHTAYFDKGAPAHLQYEISVDTGLYMDTPKWYNWFLHPSQVIRDFIKHMNNSDDATECSRIARWELGNGLKNIYGGEVIVLGDANIRAFDLLYLSDTYSKIGGLCQVEQVVHHFTPQTGFITSITPAAITIVNDPERWEFGSLMQRHLAVQDIRNTVRQQAKKINNAQANAGITGNRYDPNQLASSISTTLQSTTQFGGGATSILKDMAGASALGMVGAAAFFGPVGVGIAGLLGWKAMSWVRDNLLDAHGCYIQYLNRNGTPMDAGLSYNQGVAVGQMHVWEGLSQALGISIPYSLNGSAQITTTDLLSNIGWNQTETVPLGNSIDMWNARTKAQLINLSGKQPEGTATGQVTAGVVNIIGIVDPITVYIEVVDDGGGAIGGFTKLQLEYLVNTNDISAKSASTLATLNPAIAGVGAVQYMTENLLGGSSRFSVAGVRVNPNQKTVPGNNTTLLGTVFFRLPPDAPSPTPTGPDSSVAQLKALASQYPEIGWQDYMSNGTPFSLNWELVTKGLATIDASILFKPGQGLESAPFDMSKFGF